jgi:rRNA pseudouridine-1189 N-methylase Emg1 (Nep1/Mra1 family)
MEFTWATNILRAAMAAFTYTAALWRQNNYIFISNSKTPQFLLKKKRERERKRPDIRYSLMTIQNLNKQERLSKVQSSGVAQ